MSRILSSKNQFDDVLTNVLISDNEYASLWAKVASNEDVCADFCECLVRRLTAYDKKEQAKDEKRSKTLSKSGVLDIDITRDSYTNTLAFIALFLRVGSSDTRLGQAVARLEKCAKDVGDMDLLEMSHMLHHRVTQNQTNRRNNGDLALPGASSSNLDSLVTPTQPANQMAGDLLSGRIINYIIDVVTGDGVPILGHRLRTGNIFFWSFLRLSLSQGRYGDLLVKSLHGLLKLGASMHSDSRLALITHLMHTMLLNLPSGAGSKLSLDGVATSLAQYTVWPEPYATLVRRLLFTLSQHSKLPGHPLRSLLTSSLIAQHNIADAEFLQPQHFVLCGNHVCPASLCAMHGQQITTKQLKIALILDMVQSHMEICFDCDFEQLTDDSLNKCFAEYTTLSQTVLNSQGAGEETERVRMRGIRALYDHLRSSLPPATSSSYPSQNMPRSHMSVVLTDNEFGRVSLEQTGTSFLSSASASPASPVLPRTIAFPPRFLSIDPAKIVEGETKMHTPACVELLEQILQGARTSGTNMAKVCIHGDNQVVHSVVCAFVALKLSKPSLFDGIRFTFLLVPCSRPQTADLAAYFASRDPVYNQTIYMPFNDPSSILPVLDATKNSAEQAAPPTAGFLLRRRSLSKSTPSIENSGPQLANTPSPQLVFQHELSFFLWHANFVNRVFVYQCEGFVDRANNAESLFIPFVHSIEIGTAIETMAKQVRKDEGGAKLVTPTHFEFTIRYTPINMQGHSSNSVAEEATHCVTSLSICNISPCCAPCAPGLCLIGSQPDKKMLKRVSGRGSSFYSQSVATHDGPLHLHVAACDVMVVMRTSPFHITVDGRLFGPFHKIRMTMLTGNDQQPITVPIATYLPVSI